MANRGKDSKLQSRASEAQVAARRKLLELFQACPIPPDELLVNLGLYMRSSVVAKLLYVNELYQKIVRVPGLIMEFGVWWGQNLVLFESLRAVYEPYNYTRKVVGFDTFAGYPATSSKDGDCDLARQGGYLTGQDYEKYLRGILEYHEQENPMSQVKRFEIVKGDATATLPEYLRKHPETIISLAYFDMGLYGPTKTCLEAIKPHLVRGSIIALDELNSREFPGETIAFREVLGPCTHRIFRSEFLPDRSYVVIEQV